MLKVGIIGVTGYTGEEILRLCAHHSKVKVSYVSSKEDRGKKIQEIYPYLDGSVDLSCSAFRVEEAVGQSDLFFLSLPHTVSMRVAPLLLAKGKKVIDISADYRLQDTDEYERYYKQPHADHENLSKAVYGLPEVFRDKIKKATLIANPGCYATSVLLGIWPFIKNRIEWTGVCVMDAKSGVTGAGRGANASFLFSEVNENFKAYKIMSHQHEPEMNQIIRSGQLKNTRFVFVPHLVPLDRGILSTLYLQLSQKQSADSLWTKMHEFYNQEPFVKVLPLGEVPEVKSVLRTNQCHIGIAVQETTGTVVVVSAIDNLGKGAAGQAVQNMNLVMGFDEKEGLR